MPKITINLPQNVLDEVDSEAASLSSKRSSLVAHYIKQHFEVPTSTLTESELNQLELQLQDKTSLLDSLTNELQTAKSENRTLKNEILQLKPKNDALNKEIVKLKEDLEKHKTTKSVVLGLQKELEYTQMQKSKLESDVQLFRDINKKLEDDKDYLKEQLGRVTLLLPAAKPKIGWRERLFGVKKQREPLK